MAAQALRMMRVLGQLGLISAIPHRRIHGLKSADPGMQVGRLANSADQITAKLLVQVKHLFLQKDSLGPCFDGAKVKPKLLVHRKLKYQVRHLYYKRGLYKGVRGRDSLSVGSHRTQRQHLLYKKQTISVRCEQ
jgi:hypothetical protein